MRDGFAKSIESASVMAGGNLNEALSVSDEAVDALRQARNPRHLGTSLRINAEIAYRLRRKRAARLAIDEAVELPEQSCGFVFLPAFGSSRISSSTLSLCEYSILTRAPWETSAG